MCDQHSGEACWEEYQWPYVQVFVSQNGGDTALSLQYSTDTALYTSVEWRAHVSTSKQPFWTRSDERNSTKIESGNDT